MRFNIIMDFIYLLIAYGYEWEDIVVFTTKEEAIEKSKLYSKARVEIFIKSNDGGYIPSYNYYKNGEYIESEL